MALLLFSRKPKPARRSDAEAQTFHSPYQAAHAGVGEIYVRSQFALTFGIS